MTPEGKVKDRLKKRLAKEFMACYTFMPVQNGMGAPTIDMLCCILGVFVGIETKAPPKPGHKAPEPTARQTTTMQQIKDAGGLALLVYDDHTLDRAVDKIREVIHASS